MNKKLTLNRHVKLIQAIVLLLIVGLLTSISTGIIPINNSYNNDSENTQCILTENHCEFMLTAGRVRVDISGLLTTEEQLDISVTLPVGLTIKQARIEGVNMFMGIVPVQLILQDNGQWEGWFMLGSCTEPRMQWQLQIQFNENESPVSILFTTEQSG